MFEEMWDDSDLQYTENVMRVHVLKLKSKGDTYRLMRLYGYLAFLAANRSDCDAATDALNEQGFLVSDYGWRGTEREIWYLHDRAKVMNILGRSEWAQRALKQAKGLFTDETDPLLKDQVEALLAQVELTSPTA